MTMTMMMSEATLSRGQNTDVAKNAMISCFVNSSCVLVNKLYFG